MQNLLEQYLTFIKRLIPIKPVKPAVGLDIGENSCKMVEIKQKGDTFQLLNWAVEPIVDGDTKRAVQTLLSKLSMPSNSPITALHGKGTLIRYIDMPRMTSDELKKSFAFEVDRYFPFPKDQVYTDCYILDTAEKEDKMAVLAAASQKELVDKRMAFLKEMELQSNFITLNSIAVANILNVLGFKEAQEAQAGQEKEDPPEGAEAVAVLDMGETVSSLIILEEGLPRFTRDIFVGGRNFTKNISRASGIGLEDAEKLKCAPGAKVKEILDEKDSDVMNLALEIRLSLDYFVTEQSIPVSQLLLIGGASLLDGWDEVFTKYLEIPAKRWNPLKSLELPDVPDDGLKDNAGRLAVALGLALYQ